MKIPLGKWGMGSGRPILANKMGWSNYETSEPKLIKIAVYRSLLFLLSMIPWHTLLKVFKSSFSRCRSRYFMTMPSRWRWEVSLIFFSATFRHQFPNKNGIQHQEKQAEKEEAMVPTCFFVPTATLKEKPLRCLKRRSQASVRIQRVKQCSNGTVWFFPECIFNEWKNMKEFMNKWRREGRKE